MAGRLQRARQIEQEFYRDCFGPAAEPIHEDWIKRMEGRGYKEVTRLAFTPDGQTLVVSLNSPGQAGVVQEIRLVIGPPRLPGRLVVPGQL